MAFKFLTFFALIAAASAGILSLEHQHQHQHEQHYDHHDHSHATTTVEHHTLPIEHHAIPVEHYHHHQQAPVYHAAPVASVVSAPQHHLVLQSQHQHPHHHEHHEQYPDDPHPQYNFAYDVQDTVSGDSKSQSESRDGDVVHGEYSLNDADGFRRTVKYTADPVNGFNAVVHREPLTHKVITSAAVPVQYHHAPATVVKSPVAYQTSPVYAAAPAHHHEHHPTYTTYEVPAHHDNSHQYQYHH